MSIDNTARVLPALGDDLIASPSRSDDSQRRLRLVTEPAPRRRPRLLYGVVAVAGAVAIGAAQMGLSILTTQSSFEIAALSQQQRELTWQKQILQDDVAGLSSPQYLAANAAALGMVITESPAYLRLSDGSMHGSGEATGGASSIDALARAAVGNSLITGVPLVTDPAASLETGASVDELVQVNPATPPPIADGLPAPTTH